MCVNIIGYACIFGRTQLIEQFDFMNTRACVRECVKIFDYRGYNFKIFLSILKKICCIFDISVSNSIIDYVFGLSYKKYHISNDTFLTLFTASYRAFFFSVSEYHLIRLYFGSDKTTTYIKNVYTHFVYFVCVFPSILSMSV